jgi:hypothetical protein
LAIDGESTLANLAANSANGCRDQAIASKCSFRSDYRLPPTIYGEGRTNFKGTSCPQSDQNQNVNSKAELFTVMEYWLTASL